METATSFGHVSGLAIYERPDDDFDPYDEVYERCGFVRRPARADAPAPRRGAARARPPVLDRWTRTSTSTFHIRHLSLAPPGRADQLAEQVARIVGRPMDRSRPLWEVYVIEGLESGRWALLTKYHHATIDGASGVMMLNLMHDTAPDAATAGREPAVGRRRRSPAEVELMRLTARQPDAQPGQGGAHRSCASSASSPSPPASPAWAPWPRRARIGDQARWSRPGDGPRVDLPIVAGAADAVEPLDHRPPPVRHALGVARQHQAAQGRHRRDGQRRRHGDLRRCPAGVPRREHGALTDRPLRAMVPVSIRTGDEEDTWTNRVSGLVVDLPTNLRRPARACRPVPRGDAGGQAAVRAGAGGGA